jgi:hypothetical protein
MSYSLKVIENGWHFGFGYFTMSDGIKRGLVVNVLFWELTLGFGQYEINNVDELWSLKK